MFVSLKSTMYILHVMFGAWGMCRKSVMCMYVRTGIRFASIYYAHTQRALRRVVTVLLVCTRFCR